MSSRKATAVPPMTPTSPPARQQTVGTVAVERLRSATKADGSMVCIILVAGHDDLLEREIAADDSGEYEHLRGVPKALLPATRDGEETILGRWWREVNSRHLFNECYLITNAHQYKHFERWATANGFPVDNIINDGTTTYDGRLGAAADLDLVLRAKGLAGADAMLIAGDMLFSQGFDISGVQRVLAEEYGQKIHGPSPTPPAPTPPTPEWYEVSGAGSSEWNGRYVKDGELYGGLPVYRSNSSGCPSSSSSLSSSPGVSAAVSTATATATPTSTASAITCALYAYARTWRIGKFGREIFYVASSTSATPPLSGWLVANGSVPAPQLVAGPLAPLP